MPRTRSALTRAPGIGAGHQPQKQRQQQEQQQQQHQPEKPHISASTPCGGLLLLLGQPLLSPRSQGASVPPDNGNGSTSNNNISTISISNSSTISNNNDIVARAATMASTRARPSFDPVPMECPDFPSPCRQQGETAVDGISSTSNASASSSCAIINVDRLHTETTDNNADAEDNPMDSSLVSIELVGLLDGAPLSLPSLGEVFSPDRRQQQYHQRQHRQHQQHQPHDIFPVPLIRGSSGNPDATVFDFDVDEIDAMIGELVENQEQGHERDLASEQGGRRKNLRQVREEEGDRQQQQQQQQQQHEEHGHDEQQQQQRQGDQRQAAQEQGQQQQQDDVEVEEKVGGVGGQQEASSIAAAASTATAAATFAAPLKAVSMDVPVAEALEDAMTLTQRKEASTKDVFAHACNVAVQNQVEVVQSWQKVLTTVHTAAVLLRADNVKLLASNAVHESEKRGMVARISGLENRVSSLIAERDCLAAKLQESRAESSAETPVNGNGNGSFNGNGTRNGSDNEDLGPGARGLSVSLATPGLGVSLATPRSETTSNNRASAVTAAAPTATSATSVALPALASGTVTGQNNSIMTTAVAAAMSVITATPTMTRTMAPQECELGLVIPTASPSVSPLAVAAAFPTKASTAEPAAHTMTKDELRPEKVTTPVASTTAVAAPTPPATTTATTTALATKASIAEPATPTARNDRPRPPKVPTTAASTTATSTTTSTPRAIATATPTKLLSEKVTEKSTRRGRKVGDVVIEGRVPWVGGGARNALFPSPSAVGNRVHAMSPLAAAASAERRGSGAVRRASLVGGGVGGGVFPPPSAVGNRVQSESPLAAPSAERLSSAVRRAATATRSPLSAVSINTPRREVPSAEAGKAGKTAAPGVDKPGRASLTRGTESVRAAARPAGMVAVKRIASDDKGSGGGRPTPEGMYGRLRSASRPQKADAKVVAGGGQKVVSGTGVSSRSRQEAVINKGAAAAGRRGKVVPKKRWV